MTMAAALAAVAAMLSTTALLVGYEVVKGGLFRKPEVHKRRVGPFVLLYRNVLGPYKDVSVVFEELIKLRKLKADELKPSNSNKAMGFYYDDLKTTAPSQCRCSAALCIYEGKPVPGEEQALAALVKALSSAGWVKENNLEVAEFPESEVACVEWPYRGIISIMLGIWKAYPALNQEAAQLLGVPMEELMVKNGKRCGSIEIYDREALKEYVCFSATNRQCLLAFDRPA